MLARRSRAGVCALLLYAASEVRCGPTVPVETESQGGGGSGATSMMTTAATGVTSVPDTSTSRTSSIVSTGTASTDASGRTTTLPSSACPDPPPPGDPFVPSECEPVWLVDGEATVIEGAWSGLASCTGRDGFDLVVYRTAAVACPDLVGDECLCDADCPTGEACLCANELMRYGNECFPADCASAEDCGGALCRVDQGDCLGAWDPSAIRCTSDADDCRYDSECESTDLQFCDYDETNELFTCDPGAICE